MTKKDAALRILGVARSIHRESAGDEDADVWIIQLLWIAEGLDPLIVHHEVYLDTLGSGDSRKAKLRRLIEHPETPSGEREAAVAALGRLRTIDHGGWWVESAPDNDGAIHDPQSSTRDARRV